MPYAERTEVSPEKSRAEIERTLTRYGATHFAYGNSPSRAVIMFEARHRRVRFEVPIPDPLSKVFTRDTRGHARSTSSARAGFEQEVRRRWRALAIVIKAKLEAVESNIVSFEQEFGMHMVLPNGRTVFDEVQPKIDRAYESGAMTPMLENF